MKFSREQEVLLPPHYRAARIASIAAQRRAVIAM